MSESVACAQAVIGQLLAQGVTELVLAPGSRSAPLALVAEAAARRGGLRLHVRVDERSAGFLALGLAKASQRCVPVVTTSGTAVGNLLPAVMEAHHSGVPLLVVSADRPAALVGTGANQTTEQLDLFAGFLRYRGRLSSTAPAASWAAQSARACLAAIGSGSGWPGPAQLNLELGHPLVPVSGAVAAPPVMRSVLSGRRGPAAPLELAESRDTLVICGDATPEVGRVAVEFAEAVGLPLVAEPSSNARLGPNALVRGRRLVAGPLGERVRQVIVFGRPNLSRPITALLSRPDVTVVVINQTTAYPDPGWQAKLVAEAVELPPAPAEWLAEWLAADQAALESTDPPPVGLRGVQLAELVVQAIEADQVLCLGNSNVIRDADLAAVRTDPGPVYANRGLSGIDGGIATAMGVALATDAPTTLLLGDLSFVHDAGSLLVAPGEPRPKLRVVVADDGGGSIFATLEYGQERFAPGFERVFTTPTGLDLVALAAGFGVPAQRLSDADQVQAALSLPPTTLEVLVVDINPDDRRPAG